jgi:hypothetical protein
VNKVFGYVCMSLLALSVGVRVIVAILHFRLKARIWEDHDREMRNRSEGR